MNEILVLERKGDPDNGIMSVYTGVCFGSSKEKKVTVVSDKRRVGNSEIKGFLRKNSSKKFDNYESLLSCFLVYLQEEHQY